MIDLLFQELDAQKKETMQIECNRGSRNDLLEYLRSLDSEMVMTCNFLIKIKLLYLA